MTRSVTIGGTPVPVEAILLDGIVGLTASADGSVSTSEVIIDDPLGIYDFAEMEQWVDEESDCSLSRCFTGYIYGITTSRGPYRSGAGRQHSMTVGDLNFLLHMQPLYGAAAIRKRESGSARLAYLMTVPGMADIVFDNGLITPNAAVFPDDDLRQQYPDEVLQSICVAGIGSRIFYLTWDETAAAGEEITLFYSEPPSVLMSSTLAISNVIGSVDFSTTFEPYGDSALEAQGEEIYCGVWAIYGGAGNKLFTHNDTTHAAWFGSTNPPGLHRIFVLDLPRVGERDTAQHHSNVWLNQHSGPLETLTLTLQLPADKVNLINAGMLVNVELSHLPGFETPGKVARVNERTLSLTPSRTWRGAALYDLNLKLSLNGAPIIGGGGGEPFPFEPPPCDPSNVSLVQWAGPANSATPIVTLPAAPTLGNILIYAQIDRTTPSATPPPPSTGTWTFIRGEGPAGGGVSIGLHYKMVESGDPAAWLCSGLGVNDFGRIFEFAGVSTLDDDNGAELPLGADQLTTLTPTSGKVALLFSIAGTDFASGVFGLTMTPATGMTLIVPATPSTAQGPPSVGINYQVVSNTTGTYTVGSTGDTSGYETTVVAAAAFVCDNAGTEPPGTGQEVPGEFVALGDGTTTTFHTHFPYAPGSLKVWVDGHPILLGLTETDPSTGAFTLDFAPQGAVGDSPAERVTATYQAGAQPLQSRSDLTSANTKTDFLAKVADLSVDVIELAAGNYDWQNVVITTDRTSAPLIIRPALGATVNFVGPATTTGIIFQIGSSAANKAKWITFDGHDSAGGGAMVFKNFLLAQSGVFEPRSSDHCSFVNLTFDNIGQDTAVPGHAAFKSWIFYISGAGGGSNDHLLIDSCHLLPPLLNRDISAFQIASSGSHGVISITNIDMAEYHYALYDERPTTNLVASDWTMSDTGHSSGAYSIRITGAVSIAGLYSNIVATSSDPLSDNHSGGGVFVNGGGNSGI